MIEVTFLERKYVVGVANIAVTGAAYRAVLLLFLSMT